MNEQEFLQSALQRILHDIEEKALSPLRNMQGAQVGGRKVSLAITKLEEAQLWLQSWQSELQQREEVNDIER